MKHIAALVGLVTIAIASAQESTPKDSPANVSVPSPTIADCATDYRERGRPTEKPIAPADLADLRTALDLDLAGIQPEGLAGFGALEPVCFYLVADGRVLMRDARGWEFYFRKMPRWMPDQVVVSHSPKP